MRSHPGNLDRFQTTSLSALSATALAASPSGHWLAVSIRSNRIHIFHRNHLFNYPLLLAFSVDIPVSALLFSPDCSRLLMFSPSGPVVSASFDCSNGSVSIEQCVGLSKNVFFQKDSLLSHPDVVGHSCIVSDSGVAFYYAANVMLIEDRKLVLSEEICQILSVQQSQQIVLAVCKDRQLAIMDLNGVVRYKVGRPVEGGRWRHGASFAHPSGPHVFIWAIASSGHVHRWSFIPGLQPQPLPPITGGPSNPRPFTVCHAHDHVLIFVASSRIILTALLVARDDAGHAVQRWTGMVPGVKDVGGKSVVYEEAEDEYDLEQDCWAIINKPVIIDNHSEHEMSLGKWPTNRLLL